MRRRIMLLTVGMTTLVILCFALPIGLLIRTAVAQRTQDATLQQANSVSAFLRTGAPADAAITTYVNSLSRTTGRATSVTLPSGTVLGQTSANPGRTGQPAISGGASPQGPRDPDGNPRAELHSVPGGEVAEVRVQTSNGVYSVEVFVSDQALHAGQGNWFALLGGGSVALLLLALLAAEVLTRRIVRPLVSTARTARLLSTGDTTARAPTKGPREIAAVGTAMNALADRIDELIAEERETVADLSHRLRTPLTALRLDAESITDSDDAGRIGAHVGELERTLTAVIRAARRPQREGRMPACDATQVVADRVRFWSVLAEDQERHVSLELPDTALPVRAGAQDLAAAIDALLENIFAHTAEGTGFQVRLQPYALGAQLQVCDEGTGFGAELLVRGRSHRGSSGLGLDIARRCAESSGGELAIGRTSSGGGLITLTLHSPAG